MKRPPAGRGPCARQPVARATWLPRCYRSTPYGRESGCGDPTPLGDPVGLGYHGAVMWFRRLTLLVAMYLALDFANPMMPGAVQLVGGSLETVAGCQARGAEAPVLAVAMGPLHLSLDLFQPEAALRVPARIVSASPPVPVLIRASLEPRSTPASSSDDG